MGRLLRHRPSPAMIVSIVALFVALGGSASAVVVITSKNIKNGTIRGKDIHNRTITGKKLKNHTVAAKQTKAPEHYHAIGLPGQPAFKNGAQNFVPVDSTGKPIPGGDIYSKAGFMKDNEGFVHLRGTVTATTKPNSNVVIFTLPRGYRPTRVLDISTIASGSAGFVYVHPNGDIEAGGVSGSATYGLDSLTFRAGE